MNRTITYVLALAIMIAGASALTINTPIDQETYNGTVDVSLSADANETALAYTITSNGTNVSADSCENCSELNATEDLTDGEYLLVATATGVNLSVNETVLFTVDLPTNETNQTEDNETDGNQTEDVALELTIVSPENTTYDDAVPLNVTTTVPATISYWFANDTPTPACENCTSWTDEFELTSGAYTWTVWAVAGNRTANRTVSFTVELPVNETDNETDTNETDEEDADNETEEGPPGAYGPVFNLLPQAVERGELTDDELAEILRNNEVNPGVINRLVKTGMLGNESIDAIIEHQRTPPGIFRKVLGFFGIHVPTPKERLLQDYALSDEQKASMLVQDDISDDAAEEIAEELRAKGKPLVPPGREGREAPGRSGDAPGRPFEAGGQDVRTERGPDADRGRPADAGSDSAEGSADRGGSAGNGSGQGRADPDGSPGNSGYAPGRNR